MYYELQLLVWLLPLGFYYFLTISPKANPKHNTKIEHLLLVAHPSSFTSVSRIVTVLSSHILILKSLLGLYHLPLESSACSLWGSYLARSRAPQPLVTCWLCPSYNIFTLLPHPSYPSPPLYLPRSYLPWSVGWWVDRSAGSLRSCSELLWHHTDIPSI